MSLMTGYGKRSFSHNVKKEMESGKPQKQAVAIAYSVQRKAARKAGKKPAPKRKK